MRIGILAPTNLHLNIHEGILEFDLYICIWSASRIDLQQPPVASSWPDIIFEMRIEILTLTNLHLDMNEGILECYLYICTWPASSISLQRSPRGKILFLIWELISWPLKTNIYTCMKIYWIVTSKSVPGQPPVSASSSLQVARYYFWYENWNPGPYKPTFKHTWRHIRVWPLYLYLVSLKDWPPAASSSLQLAWYYFWNENWNPDPYKPTFRHTWRHIGELPIYLYLASLQYQPPAASRWPDIIFDMRIEILALTNLHLDIHEGISEFDLYICIWSAYRISLQDQPPAASRWPKTIFDMRIEILTLTNLHLDIHEGILESYLYICTWPASSISLQRPPGGQILFLIWELKSWPLQTYI